MKKHLIVDLDSTLIKTDVLHEAVCLFLKENPLRVFFVLGWVLFGGKINLKNKLAKTVTPKSELFPYNSKVLEYIDEKKSQGYSVGLVSASPHKWVQNVADFVGKFDFAIGSTESNLKGLKKHERIVQAIGTSEYTYVGDDRIDIEIWERCRHAAVVNPSLGILKELQTKNIEYTELSENTSYDWLKGLYKQLRVHQWAKNLLLFLPLLAAHRSDQEGIQHTLMAFVAFSFAASSVYVLNDLLDIEADRSHHSKKHRPLASGLISIRQAILLLMVLLALSTVFSLSVGLNFLLVVLFYYLLNLIYSFYLKKEVILDIILLSGMYTVRLFAGSTATGIVLSDWLLSFSTLFFFSLACVKRYTELARSQNKPQILGRGYSGIDQIAVLALGVCAGLLSILVALLYIQSDSVNSLYSKKQYLWLVTPILLYWIGRIWLLTGRNEIHDDPVVFAMKDRVSLICGFALFLVLSLSI